MPLLSAVEGTYQKEITQSNRQLKLMIAVSVVLLVLVCTLLLYVNKQRRRLALAHYGTGKNEARRKYCKECLNGGTGLIQKKCVDCGKEILIENKFNRSTCRCDECQEEKDKENRRLASLKYRKKLLRDKS